MLDYLGIMLDAEKIGDVSFTINLKLTDGDEYLVKVHYGVVLYYKGMQDENADITITTDRIGILALANNNADMKARYIVSVEGNTELYERFCNSMCKLKLYFNIIEP